MSRFAPYLLVVPLAAAIGYGIANFDPDVLHTQPAKLDEPVRDPELRERLTRNDAVVKYKDYLVREMLDGRMTLTEVADEFLRVNAEQPRILEAVLEKYPGANEREKSAHNVLAFACARCVTEAEEAVLRTRLSTEFASTFGHRPIDTTT